jgi:hypothetical protein
MSRFWERNDPDPEVKPKPTQEDNDSIEIKAQLSKIDILESSVTELKSKTAVLDRMNSYLDEQEAAKAASRAAEAAKAAKAAREVNAEDWITDPEKAATAALTPLVRQQFLTQSKVLRREVFDAEGKFEFYTGDFKRKVDAYIDALPPDRQVDTASIENCYNLVVGQSWNDIKENKLKSRFAATSHAGTGTGNSVDNQKDTPLSDDEKKAAKLFGMKDDEYSTRKKEINYV